MHEDVYDATLRCWLLGSLTGNALVTSLVKTPLPHTGIVCAYNRVVGPFYDLLYHTTRANMGLILLHIISYYNITSIQPSSEQHITQRKRQTTAQGRGSFCKGF